MPPAADTPQVSLEEAAVRAIEAWIHPSSVDAPSPAAADAAAAAGEAAYIQEETEEDRSKPML